MPQEKVRDTLNAITTMREKRSTTVKALQSILGKILHMAKCVTPARLFLEDWNGTSLINTGQPSREIVADACPRGFGAADGERCYSVAVPDHMQEIHISALEAINVLVAVSTFTDAHDRGKVIRVRCDNSAAVDVFRTGKAVDQTLLAYARAMWLIQATRQFRLVFVHTPGVEMTVADSLSRAPFHHPSRTRANQIMEINNLQLCTPDMAIISDVKCM